MDFGIKSDTCQELIGIFGYPVEFHFIFENFSGLLGQRGLRACKGKLVFGSRKSGGGGRLQGENLDVEFIFLNNGKSSL